MKKLVKFCLAVMLLGLLLLCLGCYTSITFPDGTKYTRFGPQELNGLLFTQDANGLITLSVDKQKSDMEIAFDAGVVSAQAGGGHDD